MSATTIERAEIAIPDHGIESAAPAEAIEPEERVRLSGPQPGNKRRGGLLVTVSAVALVAATAAGVYYIGTERPHAIQVAHVPPALPATHTPPIAPAASLARAPAPSRVAALPAPPSDGGDDMSAFLRDGGHPRPTATDSHPITSPPTSVQAPDLAAPKPEVLPQVGGPPASPQQVAAVLPAAPDHGASAPEGAKPSLLAAALPPSPSPSPAVPAPAALPPVTVSDAADVAAKLVPGRMTDAEQIQVLDLVTKLGTLVRNQDIRIAELQGTVSALQERIDTSLTDFGRRLTLAEATGAVNSAAAAPTSLPAPAVARTSDAVTPAVTRVVIRPAPVRTASAVSPAPADEGTHRYHVQAASPGLAMLSELDAAGGEEAQLPVAPGDNLPGYGKIISISQRGSAWVVKAQNGLIQ